MTERENMWLSGFFAGMSVIGFLLTVLIKIKEQAP